MLDTAVGVVGVVDGLVEVMVEIEKALGGGGGGEDEEEDEEEGGGEGSERGGRGGRGGSDNAQALRSLQRCHADCAGMLR